MALTGPFTRLPQPPRDRNGISPFELSKWFDKVWLILAGIPGIAWDIVDKTGSKLSDIVTRPHSMLQTILQADDTSISTGGEKHVTDAQVKKYEDHRLIIDGNPHGVAPKNIGGYTVLNKTADYTAVIGDFINVDATLGTVIITPPAGVSGKSFYVRKSDASANVVTVAGVKDILYQNTVIYLVYNDTSWSAA